MLFFKFILKIIVGKNRKSAKFQKNFNDLIGIEYEKVHWLIGIEYEKVDRIWKLIILAVGISEQTPESSPYF